MIRKKRYLAAKMGLLALGLMLLFPGQAEAADKKTIYNSPYVSFSPDGKAFTTCAGDQNYTWYAEDDSTTVYTGIKSSLRSLRTGEHYYKVARWGEVPVGSWKVVHRPGQCIHDGYTSDENWHGIQFGTQKCMQYYYSGWKAFCADCGEPLEDSNIYMSREAASSIQYLDLGSEKNPVFYYYLCPFCRNLEQGVGLSAHWCKKISWNQYRIFYDPNIKKYNGYMDYSYHMYNNETIYEGETVTPVNYRKGNYVSLHVPDYKTAVYEIKEVCGIKEISGQILAETQDHLILEGKDGKEISVAKKEIYDEMQTSIVEKAMSMDQNVRDQIDLIGNPKLSAPQMDQILNGINDGLQPLLVAQYANPKIPAWQMDIYRYGMLNGLGYDQIKVGCLQDWDSSRNNIDNMIKEQRGHIVSDLKANNYIPEKRLVHKIGRLNGLTGGKFNKVSDIVNSVKSGKISNRYGEASLLKEIGDDLQHQRKIMSPAAQQKIHAAAAVPTR